MEKIDFYVCVNKCKETFIVLVTSRRIARVVNVFAARLHTY